MKLLVKIVLSLLSAVKAFFTSIIQVVWAFSGMLLLAGLLVYFKQDTSTITYLLEIIGYIQIYWMLIWLVLFVLDYIVIYKEMIPPDPNKEITKALSRISKMDKVITEKTVGL